MEGGRALAGAHINRNSEDSLSLSRATAVSSYELRVSSRGLAVGKPKNGIIRAGKRGFQPLIKPWRPGVLAVKNAVSHRPKKLENLLPENAPVRLFVNVTDSRSMANNPHY